MNPPAAFRIIARQNYDLTLLERHTRPRQLYRITHPRQLQGLRNQPVFRLPGGDYTVTLWAECRQIMRRNGLELIDLDRAELERPDLRDILDIHAARVYQRHTPPAIGETCLCLEPDSAVLMPSLGDFAPPSRICSRCRRPFFPTLPRFPK